MAQIPCLACKKVLFESVALNDSGEITGLGPGLAPKIEYDRASGSFYMKCRHCGAKNAFRDDATLPATSARLVLDRLLD
jgi:hypothetical protein